MEQCWLSADALRSRRIDRIVRNDKCLEMTADSTSNSELDGEMSQRFLELLTLMVQQGLIDLHGIQVIFSGPVSIKNLSYSSKLSMTRLIAECWHSPNMHRGALMEIFGSKANLWNCVDEITQDLNDRD